ncbi:MAG TPA: hypothetical protein EYO33_18240 [Phycisphaerales bacterium]|nr:hypothetical protein [Phycisphaerales bacterium]
MNRRGTTIMELMVSIGLLALITTILAFFLSSFRTAAEGGDKRLEMRAIHREVQTRIHLLLRSAIPPNEVTAALVWPEPAGNDTFCRFHAPADLVDASVAFDPRTPDYPEFTLSYEAGTRRIILQRSDATGPIKLIGRDFDSVDFAREDRQGVKVTLRSNYQVRSASGGRKNLVHESINRVLLNAQE